jgi:hypothetical protein
VVKFTIVLVGQIKTCVIWNPDIVGVGVGLGALCVVRGLAGAGVRRPGNSGVARTELLVLGAECGLTLGLAELVIFVLIYALTS